MKNLPALSIRQPYAEQIMRGTKKIEYRSKQTWILNQRFYVYASSTCGTKEKDEFARMKKKPGAFPTGVLVGMVEISKCTRSRKGYQWHLRKPQRLPKSKQNKPTNHAQPVWFYPSKR